MKPKVFWVARDNMGSNSRTFIYSDEPDLSLTKVTYFSVGTCSEWPFKTPRLKPGQKAMITVVTVK
jgi:hypothetical protein